MKYLFSVYFSDDTTLHQTPEDVSGVDPLRSAFFDVARRISEVVTFQLHNNQHSYTVDLRDGHFEVDGVPFHAQPVASPQALPPEGKYELIYFRDVTRHFNVEPDEAQPQAAGVTIGFRFGWKYTVLDGRTWTQTLVIT